MKIKPISNKTSNSTQTRVGLLTYRVRYIQHEFNHKTENDHTCKDKICTESRF